MSTVELPDEVFNGLERAAAERGMTADQLAAQVLAEQFGPQRRRLSFAAAGASTSGRSAAEAEQLLAEGGFGTGSATG